MVICVSLYTRKECVCFCTRDVHNHFSEMWNKKLHFQEVKHFQMSTQVTYIIKIRNAYKILVTKPEGKMQLEKWVMG
jgi:hypothetical protein